MALIVCKDCSQKYSSDAKGCIHCGAKKPVKQWSGSTILIILIVILVMPTLAVFLDGKTKKNSNAEFSCIDNWQFCKDNADLVNHYHNYLQVQVACKMAATDVAKYGDPEFPWVSFGSFNQGNDYSKTGIIYAYENNARFQNAFGTKVKTMVSCKYDLDHNKVLDIQISEK